MTFNKPILTARGEAEDSLSKGKLIFLISCLLNISVSIKVKDTKFYTKNLHKLRKLYDNF